MWKLFLFILLDKLSLLVFCGLKTKWTLVVSGFDLVVSIIAKHGILDLAADAEEVLVFASIYIVKVSLRFQPSLPGRSKQIYIQIHVSQMHMMNALTDFLVLDFDCIVCAAATGEDQYRELEMEVEYRSGTQLDLSMSFQCEKGARIFEYKEFVFYALLIL
jgi:hypothetical protein